MIIGICIILIAWLVKMPYALSILLTIIGGWKVIVFVINAAIGLGTAASKEENTDNDRE